MLTPSAAVLQSFLHGKLVNASDPAAVALRESRGFESYRSKHLLRWTVILSDLAGKGWHTDHGNSWAELCSAK
jgi:hypothetical protein